MRVPAMRKLGGAYTGTYTVYVLAQRGAAAANSHMAVHVIVALYLTMSFRAVALIMHTIHPVFHIEYLYS